MTAVVPGVRRPISEHEAELTDSELAEAVRSGDVNAFGMLYMRHAGAALSFALRFRVGQAVAEDVVAESFTRVFSALLAGGGPTKKFRPYLFAAVRANLCNALRHDRRDELTDDPSQGRHDRAAEDVLNSMFESVLLARAFAQLPTRWQTVLWCLEVEGQPAAEVADRLEVSANAVAALAYRAREGLRNAYFRAHLVDNVPDECQRFVTRIGPWLRDKISKKEKDELELHVSVCKPCSESIDELMGAIGRLRQAAKSCDEGPTPASSGVQTRRRGAALICAVLVIVGLVVISFVADQSPMTPTTPDGVPAVDQPSPTRAPVVPSPPGSATSQFEGSAPLKQVPKSSQVRGEEVSQVPSVPSSGGPRLSMVDTTLQNTNVVSSSATSAKVNGLDISSETLSVSPTQSCPDCALNEGFVSADAMTFETEETRDMTATSAPITQTISPTATPGADEVRPGR